MTTASCIVGMWVSHHTQPLIHHIYVRCPVFTLYRMISVQNTIFHVVSVSVLNVKSVRLRPNCNWDLLFLFRMPWLLECLRCHNHRQHLGQHIGRVRQSINDHKCTHDNRRHRHRNRHHHLKVLWSLYSLAISANVHRSQWSNEYWRPLAPSSVGNVCQRLDSANTS